MTATLDWVVPSNGALSKRQHTLGLPLQYAALLITSSLMLVLVFHEFLPGVYVFGFGWVMGRVITYFDPFAFDLMARSLRIPRIMRP